MLLSWTRVVAVEMEKSRQMKEGQQVLMIVQMWVHCGAVKREVVVREREFRGDSNGL